MTEQMITGGKLWDEILKAIVYVMPRQLLPFIKEVYGKEYPPDTPVRFLGTEHSTFLDKQEDSLSSNLMDISLLVGETDYYHIECQMENDKLMVVRMISYDLHYAIEHCITEDGDEITIRFPHSVVLYPDKNGKLPDELRCRVIFQDESQHIYRIPTVRIQSYSLEEVHKKHLTLFIPYLLLRLKPRIKSKTCPLSQKELTGFLSEIILILQDELTDGYLTRQECNDYLRLLVLASERVFFHYPKYHEEVKRMTKPLIYLPSMKIMELEEQIAEKDSKLAEKDSKLAEMDLKLAEKESETKKLSSEVEKLRKELRKAAR